MWSTPMKIAWGVTAFLLLVVVLWSLRYFVFGAEAYFPKQRELYERETLGLLTHIGGMMVAAIMGPLQFVRPFRNRHPSIHRAMGRIYLGGVLVGGLGGLYMAQYSASGIVSDIGFSLLAIAILAASAFAFFAIKRGALQDHREWMTRSFALLLAAVTLRIYLPILEGFFGEQDGYALVAWLCWVPNLLVAEWLIRTQLRTSPERSLVPA